jgi:hypothetical protein
MTAFGSGVTVEVGVKVGEGVAEGVGEGGGVGVKACVGEIERVTAGVAGKEESVRGVQETTSKRMKVNKAMYFMFTSSLRRME